MPGKKTSDSDEQFHTGLETLELWILVLQHHQSQQNMGQPGGTTQSNPFLQKLRIQKATRKIISLRRKRKVSVPTSRTVQVCGTISIKLNRTPSRPSHSYFINVKFYVGRLHRWLTTVIPAIQEAR
jgi:hypothetical protein